MGKDTGTHSGVTLVLLSVRVLSIDAHTPAPYLTSTHTLWEQRWLNQHCSHFSCVSADVWTWKWPHTYNARKD